MDEQQWITRSQNLYIIREIWGKYAERDADAFHNLIGINDSHYSSFIRKKKISAEADRKIKKCREKIVNAGFKYEWFTGEIPLCDRGFLINSLDWERFTMAKRGTPLYRKIAEQVKERMWLVISDLDCEAKEVYKVVLQHNPRKVAKQFEKYLDSIDLKSLSEVEIKEIVKLSEKVSQFMKDVEAIKRYYEIRNEKNSVFLQTFK